MIDSLHSGLTHPNSSQRPLEMKDLYQQILDSSDDCIKVLDLEGRILFMNRGGQGLLGIEDITPFLNTCWVNFWQESERQAAREAIAQASAGKVCTIQGYCPTMSGEPKWWDNKISPIRGAEGQVERLLCISRDITERVRIENERQRINDDRRRREANAAFLAEIGEDFSYLLTADEIMQTVGAKIGAYLQVTTCNFTDVDEAQDRVTVHYGWSSPEVPSTVGTFRISQYLSKEFERASRAGETVVICNTQTDSRTDAAGYAALNMYSFVTVPFHRNGRWTHYIAICDSRPRDWQDDEIALIEEISNRIFPRLERARIEAALRESEERFRSLATTIPQLIWTATPDGSVNYLSDQWMDYIGMPPEQLYDWSWQQITHPEDLPNTVRQWKHSLQSGEPLEIQHRFRNRTGEWRWQLVRGVPIKDAAGNVKQWVGTCTDIQNEVDIKEALRESEEKYRSLFNSMDEGFCLIEVLFDQTGKACDYRFLEANPALEKHTGLVNVVGKTIRELVPNHDAYWFDIYGKIALTGVPERFENAAEGLGRFYDVYAFQAGEPQEHKVAVLFKDISERKRVEDERKKVEQERERFLAVGSDLQVITGMSRYFRWVSPSFERLLGWTPDEMTSRPWTEFVHPEDSNPSVAETDRLFSGNETSAFENRYRHKDGSYRWLLWSAQFYPDEQVIYGAAVDITHVKQTEAAIAADLKDTQLLRDLSVRLTTETDIQVLYDEILAAAIALTKADAGSFQFFDHAKQELLLLATRGVSPTLAEKFDHINTRANTSCGIALATGKRSFIDFDVPASEDPDGLMRTHVEAGLLSAQSTPLISRSGKLIGMVSTHWRTHHRPSDPSETNEANRELRFLDLLARQAADLIEQRQDEAQRQQLLEREQAARKEAERANRVKDEFLAVLSHELRSPLNPILGWTRLLQGGKLNPMQQTEALKTIERNAKLQTQLIDDLLDISRIMQGKLSLTAAPVSLTSVIAAAVETVRLAAEAKQVEVKLDLTPTTVPVLGDAARLQQVVWNLLTNAVKFTPNGGRVTIELRQLDQLAQIRVIDTGKGISSAFLPHVFEFFRQEDGSTTREFGGLGLGLAIVRQIVEMHGGTVWAESQGEGQGAMFIVQLPLSLQAQSSELELSPDSSMMGNALSNLHILLVDDQTDTREFEAFVLEQSGAIVTAVACGMEALQALDRSVPDVIVSDIGMAEMDGYRLIQQIRSRSPVQGGMIPAIALTAYASRLDQQKALQFGFQAHLTKPVEPEALVRAIVSLLGSH